MRDALVVLQVLRQDEEVLRVQSNIDQHQLLYLIRFDVVQRHIAAIYLQFFYTVLEHEFGQILQAEFYHFLIFEID